MSTFIRLVDYEDPDTKMVELLNQNNRHSVTQRNFSKIPGSPISYWISDTIYSAFKFTPIGELYPLRKGNSTSNNARFLRLWYEVEWQTVSILEKSVDLALVKGKRWIPYNKGGGYRKWYGFNEYLVDWKDNGQAIRIIPTSVVTNEKYYMKPGLTWSTVSSNKFSIRYFSYGFIFDNGGCCIFELKDKAKYILSLFSSKMFPLLLGQINPTLNFQSGEISKFPLATISDADLQVINELTTYCMSMSKVDWDSNETSWDFVRSPLLTDYSAPNAEIIIDDNLYELRWPSIFQRIHDFNIAAQAMKYMEHWTKVFMAMHSAEERINSILIDLYKMGNELTNNVSFEDITLLQNTLVESSRREGRIDFDEIELAKCFISYGVGCLLGRYSTEGDGLILADRIATIGEFHTKLPSARFIPDEDSILPLTDEDDFSDDLPTAFKSWLRFISGSHYDENLRWIEKRVGKDLRTFFDRDFYKDHIRRYKSHPIYWMVSSPSGAFRALIYLHRYTKDTVGKILNDYVRPYRTKIAQKIRGLESTIDSVGSSAGEKTKAKKRFAQLENYRTEIETWEKERLYPLALKRVELDLDDGVKVNYRKLEGILEPVKQLEAKDAD